MQIDSSSSSSSIIPIHTERDRELLSLVQSWLEVKYPDYSINPAKSDLPTRYNYLGNRLPSLQALSNPLTLPLLLSNFTDSLLHLPTSLQPRPQSPKKANEKDIVSALIRSTRIGISSPREIKIAPSVNGAQRKLVSLKGHTSAIYCCMLCKFGRRLFTGGDDNLIKVWDVKTGWLLKTIRSFNSIAGAVDSGCVSELRVRY
jgi:WD40 repeat protein